MTEGLPLKEMIIQGWPVFTVLFSLSVLSFAVMCERWMVFKRARLNTLAFIDALKKQSGNPDFSKAIGFCRQFHKPFARIVLAVLSESGDRSQKERILHRAIQAEVRHMESYVSILGTVGSITPFVGLLGTVVGIIKAFQAISVSFGGGPGVVAAGIAEALINTAMGLFVAIPAVVAFNYYNSKLRRFIQEWEIGAGEVLDWAVSKEHA